MITLSQACEFGAAVPLQYVKGTDFDYAVNSTCTAGCCYAIDSASSNASTQAFKDFQALLNTFASAAGFTPLTIDGLLGVGTLNAVLALVQSNPAAASTDAGQGVLNNVGDTQAALEAIATYMPGLIAALTTKAAPARSVKRGVDLTPKLMSKLTTAYAATHPVTAESADAAVAAAAAAVAANPTDPAAAAAYAAALKQQSLVAWPWYYWAAIGLGAVVVAGTVIYFVRKP